MKAQRIIAKPLAMTLHPERGYELTAIVVEGPVNLLERIVKVGFASWQLNAIAEWEPTQAIERIDLQKGDNPYDTKG